VQRLELVKQYIKLVILDASREGFEYHTGPGQNFVELISKTFRVKFFPGTNVKYQVTIKNESGQNVWALEIRYSLADVSKRELLFPGSEYIHPKNENGNFEVSEMRSVEIFNLLKELEQLLNSRR